MVPSTLPRPIGFSLSKIRFAPSWTSIAIVIVFAVFLFFETQLFLRSSLQVFHPRTRMRNAFSSWQLCMAAHFEDVNDDYRKLWNDFERITTYCTSHTDVSRITLTPLKNEDETKHYILSKNETERSVVVTLGVGEDIKFEKQLKELLPNGSEFFGADPISLRNAKLFSQVGKFFPIAVSNYSGRANSFVYYNRQYRNMTVDHVDFITFIKEMVNRSRIDHLLLDNEGPEYDIVPMIAVDDSLHNHRIVICHLNVEFHHPMHMISRYREFAFLMRAVLMTGRFAAIHNKNVQHQRMFLVNYRDPFCIMKYLQQFF